MYYKKSKRMNITNVIFYFFSSFAIISSIMVSFSKNPMFSALFLILCFFNVSCILFLLELDYLPLVFLIVYVGAIAVLFLFVIMMLNIRLSELKENNYQFFPIALLFGIIFILQISFLCRSEFVSLSNFEGSTLEFTSALKDIFYSINSFQNEHNMKNLGFLIFFDFYYLFILSSVILLLAMVGVIVLTLQKTFLGKEQKIPMQVLQKFEKNLRTTTNRLIK